MVRYFLKLDYSFSRWIGKKNQALDGTVHLFLTKVGFVVQSLYFIILPILPVKLSIEIAVIGIMVFTAISYYGFIKTTKRLINNYKLKQDYKNISKQLRNKRAILALIIFVVSFCVMCFIAVKSFGGYST